MIRTAVVSAVLALAGIVAVVAGTSVHRVGDYWGLALALGLVLAGATFARAWRGFLGLAAFAAGVFVAIAVASQNGPGGSVVILADLRGYVWQAGAGIAAVLPAGIPGRFVRREPDAVATHAPESSV